MLYVLILFSFSITKIQQIIEITKFILTFFSEFHIVHRYRQDITQCSSMIIQCKPVPIQDQ